MKSTTLPSQLPIISKRAGETFFSTSQHTTDDSSTGNIFSNFYCWSDWECYGDISSSAASNKIRNEYVYNMFITYEYVHNELGSSRFVRYHLLHSCYTTLKYMCKYNAKNEEKYLQYCCYFP